MQQVGREMQQRGDIPNMLEVRRLEKVIENHTVLAIESLEVHAGEIVAVIGQERSGKSLLIRLLSGVMPASGGSILLNGKPLSATGTVRIGVGVLFEEDLLYKRHSAVGNLEPYCQMYKVSRTRMYEVLALVGLSDQANRAVEKLAPSARRRLAFARMLVNKPSLLLLDRPILRTDLDTQVLFAHLITQAASEGAAVLLTDEDLAWAGKFCTRVVELEDGRISNTRHRVIGTEQDRIQEPVGAGEPVVPVAPERLQPFKIPARKDDRILLYDPVEILFATSRDGKTYLRTANEESTTNLTLQELETRLAGRGFFKAHRAYLVNLQHIKAVIQFTRNSYTLQLNDKQETMIPLSKQSEKELQTLLGY